MDCRAAVLDACRGAHRLLDREEAVKDAQAKMATAQTKLQAARATYKAALTAAQRETAQQQAQLDALAKARELTSPVLKARVAKCEPYDADGWRVEGGDIHIAMAATQTLTDEEQKAVCEALQDLEVEYELDKTDCVVASGGLAVGALDVIKDKLPDCVQGQTARKGDVLLSALGQLEVYFVDMPSKGGPGVKMFGRVLSGLDALEGTGCDGDPDYDMGEECLSGAATCFCRTGDASLTTISDFKFEAGELQFSGAGHL